MKILYFRDFQKFSLCPQKVLMSFGEKYYVEYKNLMRSRKALFEDIYNNVLIKIRK